MRYLRKQVLNRRAPFDTRFYIDATDGVVMANSNNITLPNSNNTIVNPQEGMIRYNTSTHEVEVYQGTGGSAGWRSLRYKEAAGITRETYTGNNSQQIYGPLSIQPPSTVQTGSTWTGDSLIVIVGNVYQTWSSNYVIVTGATLGAPYNTPPNDTKYYIQFTSTTPGLDTPIVILHGIDQ